jgi:hypothetical protein
MVGLIDIAPAVENVTVGANKVPVYGVSAKGIALLLARFPELREMMSGREVGVDKLLAMGGDAVAAIIAAGCGYPGDQEQEAAAGRLPVEVQADFLAPILRLTMPKGVGPFVEKLAGLGSVLGVDPSSMEQASKSPKRSMNSSAPVTTKQASGDAPLVN